MWEFASFVLGVGAEVYDFVSQSKSELCRKVETTIDVAFLPARGRLDPGYRSRAVGGRGSSLTSNTGRGWTCELASERRPDQLCASAFSLQTSSTAHEDTPLDKVSLQRSNRAGKREATSHSKERELF